ncbi:TonB-dependent receptor [Sphingobacterium olei]|uniref:TonB-dependent receptor n=1 Tax=Sphingobacterium olei TaxID=2571155 RepID=A0A4U0P096_9SPHI|nr:TonB-dependent receptor [Sphingobacterium olei]TJZ59922.1 TonB-dependent receptor [Sphingobacterium olei]
MKRLLLITLTLWVSIASFAQDRQITGSVVEKGTGLALQGVSILLRGTQIATTTDGKGQFALRIRDTGMVELEFKNIGFVTQIVPVEGNEPLTIELVNEEAGLDEVVVIGYGAATSIKDLTGSVASVSGKTLARVPVSSAAEALQGKAAGVQVTMADGAPGAEINIRIRGGTSVTQSNAPLFIVDGFPVSNINDIPPTDILSIDILKDASLTAIYGARGGNGVVVVTTKRAQAGKISLNFNHNTQVRSLARKIEVMSPYEFVKIQYESVVGNNTNRQKFRGNFGNPADFSLYKRFEGNDWQDEILGGNPISQMYNLTLSGGTQSLKFNTSITHHDEEGVLIKTGVMRTNVNTKLNADLAKNVKLLINPRFTYRQDRGPGADKVGGGGLINVLRYRPTNGLREFSFLPAEDIDPEDERFFAYTNPKGDIDQNYRRENRYEFTNQASVEWAIIPQLTFRTLGSQFMGFRFSDLFFGDLTSEARNNNGLPVVQLGTVRQNRYGWTNTLQYAASKGKHNYSVLAGQEIQTSTEYSTAQGSRYFPKAIEAERAIRNLGLGTPWGATSFMTSPERLSSYFGQANYNFDRKYLLSLTYRADGSTKFAPGNQWGYFPAISGGWVISNEEFMANQDVFTQLKLRAAIGKSGNNRITDDMWRYQYGINTGGGPGWGELNDIGFEYYGNTGGSTLPNPDIRWETTLTRNLAFDIETWQGRLTITPEAYWNTTTDLLYLSNIPTTTGYTRQMQNIGQVTNRGFDLTINAQIIKRDNAYFNTTFTFGSTKTRVDKLNGAEDVLWMTSDRWKSSDFDYMLKVGDQLGLIYGYQYDGIYRFDEFDLQGLNWVAKPGTVNNDALFGTQPGRPKFKNHVDEEGEENVVNDRDKVVIGNTNPKFSGGFNLVGGWRNFDMSANFFFMYGFDVNNATRYTLSSFESNANNYFNILPEFNENARWRYADDVYGDRMVSNALYTTQYQEVNADATIFNPVDIGKKVTHSYFIEDGSFLRLQDVTLGYTLPKSTLSRLKLGTVRVFVSGYNLFLWTNYRGYDPEVDVQTGLTPGVDYNRYPRSRNFLAGLNITF